MPLEVRRAVDAGADIIGVNNRDLRSLDVRANAAAALADDVPAEVVAVAESGLREGSKRPPCGGQDRRVPGGRGAHARRARQPRAPSRGRGTGPAWGAIVRHRAGLSGSPS